MSDDEVDMWDQANGSDGTVSNAVRRLTTQWGLPTMKQESTTQFTAQQLSDWKAYEKVRKSGNHNMYFPGARRATGLSEERYSFVLHNYSELKTALGL